MTSRHLAILLAPVLMLGFAACATAPPLTAPPASASATPIVASASPSGSASATLTPTPVPPSSDDPGADLVLSGDGLGTYSFGAKQADVTELLEDQLGDPDESAQGVRCELDDSSPWAQTVSWGGFWVEYDAKDQSRKSPRTLAAWGYDLKEQLKAPLVMQDGVPLNLTFAQLKAAYPKGKTEDLGLGDGSKRFILPNKIYFIGSGKSPTAVQAGEFGTCE